MAAHFGSARRPDCRAELTRLLGLLDAYQDWRDNLSAVSQVVRQALELPPGCRERVRFAEPVPLMRGFARIAELLEAAGRPKAAFAAYELRSPAPFTEETFAAFNCVYGGVLTEWGVFRENGLNPVARSNVCPAIAPPSEPSFHAFVFTVPDPAAPPSFAIAGSAEAPEGKPNYHDYIIAPGDVSPTGLRTKAHWVLGEMERRMGLLGAG
jgi:hypothetical protein